MINAMPILWEKNMPIEYYNDGDEKWNYNYILRQSHQCQGHLQNADRVQLDVYEYLVCF